MDDAGDEEIIVPLAVAFGARVEDPWPPTSSVTEAEVVVLAVAESDIPPVPDVSVPVAIPVAMSRMVGLVGTVDVVVTD
jgi:hypothetical protein